MKNAQKLVSILLALVMMFSMTIPALAEGETGSIEVSNPVDGQTYAVYQLLDVAKTEGDPATYFYTAVAAWEDFFAQSTIPGGFLEVFQGYVVVANEEPTAAEVKAFTDAALTYAEENSIAAIDPDEGTTATFTGLALGYYLVESSQGAVCSLTTTDPAATVLDKNGAPTVEKKVNEGSIPNSDETLVNANNDRISHVSKWVDTNDISIGAVANFRTTITAQAGASNYILHDAMGTGMELYTAGRFAVGVELQEREFTTTANDNVATEAVLYSLTKDTHYSVVTDPDDGCAFHVVFDQDFLDKIDAYYKDTPEDVTELATFWGATNHSRLSAVKAVPEQVKIVVEYQATLTAEANQGEVGHYDDADYYNTNTTWLTYGANDTKTNEDTTRTYMWQFSVYKYTLDKDAVTEENTTGETALSGAEFQVYGYGAYDLLDKTTGDFGWKTNKANYLLSFTKVSDTVYQLDPNGTVTELVTPANGTLTLLGLDAGPYFVEETAAPAGYHKLNTPIQVYIFNSQNASNAGTVEIKTEPRTELNATTNEWELKWTQQKAADLTVNNGDADRVPVLNNSGALLPSTGGVGTVIFYVIGGLLVIGAAAVLVVKKRCTAH